MRRAILGVGSAHGDDQIGWHLVDCLSDRHIGSDLEFEKISAPGASLIDCFRRYDHVLLLDAGELDLDVGAFSLVENAADSFLAKGSQQTHFSSHSLGVADAYQLALQLQFPLPQISLFLVQMEQTETMATISDELQVRIPEYIKAVERFMVGHV